jgi:hypothetical protein
MVRNLIVLLFLLATTMNIGKADWIEVDNLYLETEKTFGTNRGYTLPEDSKPKYNFNMGMDMTDGLGILYNSSKISSTVDQSQFRYVGLDTEIGLNTTLGFQIYYRHFSGHVLDAVMTDRFPQENVIGLRFNLLGK